MDARSILIRPVISEKSYALIAEGKYTFRVDDRAHKTQIAQAVEEVFSVNVAAVRTELLDAKIPIRNPFAAPAIGRRACRQGQHRAASRLVVEISAIRSSLCPRRRWPGIADICML